MSSLTPRFGASKDGVGVGEDRLNIYIICKDNHLQLIFIITTDVFVDIYVVFRFFFPSVVSILKSDPGLV